MDRDDSPVEAGISGTGERDGPLYRCLMVTTGREEYVLRLLSATHLGACLIPKKTRIRRVRGDWKQEEVPMLPGYLFIREEEEVPIWKYQRIQDVIRVLRYEREPYGYLRAGDLRFAETVFRSEGVVAPLQAVEEGDLIRICDGILRDMNGTVLSVDRHKRQAKIRLELMGIPRIIWMNYVLLEKQEPVSGTKGNDVEGNHRETEEKRAEEKGENRV